MLSKISWHQWWLFIAAATTAYYAFVALLFFRKDIVRLLSGQRHTGNANEEQWPETEYEDTEEETFDEEDEQAATGYEAEEEEETIAAADEAATEEESPARAENNPEEDEDLAEGQAEENLALMEAISEAIANALSGYNGYANKEEVILKLAHVMKAYREAPAYELYEEAIDWHMNEQARLHCGTSLSERDLGRIRDSAAEL